MKKPMITLVALVVAIAAQAAELPLGTDTSRNYLKNGSFEIGRDNFDYCGWQNNDPTGWSFSITNAASAGKRALFVEKAGSYLSQHAYVPGGTYVYTVTIRANPETDFQLGKGKPPKGLGMSYGANFRMEKGGKETRLGGHLLGGCPKDGTPAWQRLVSAPIIIPTNIYGNCYMHIQCGVFHVPKGTGLIDDVALYRVNAPTDKK